MQKFNIIDTTALNIQKYGICGYKDIKKPGYPQKIEWIKKNISNGLKIKTLYLEDGGTQGMIEYIPGEYAWRPVEAKKYMFINCIFVGYRKEYKGRGYATALINECIKDAQKENKLGVAVVTRKGSFMAGKDIFIKTGFELSDSAKPDFELMAKRFDKKSALPKFNKSAALTDKKYSSGLVIIRADQCPYSVKNVIEIAESAKTKFGIIPKIINLKDSSEAQNSPSPFGTFCILYNGEVVAHNPVSNTRFENIMMKILK